jgi:Lon protease-like protein
VPETVPLFPLDVVLFPGRPLPLHIFEPRYRRLVADVTAGNGRRVFGIVAVGAGRVPVAEVGTIAEILSRQPYPDGRSDLLTVGSRRFRIESLDPGSRPYLQGEVEWLEEVDGDIAADTLQSATRLMDVYAALLRRIAGDQPEQFLPDDALRASYEIAGRLHLGLAERQELLAAGSAAERLTMEIALLRREVRLVAATRAVPVPASALRVTPGAN